MPPTASSPWSPPSGGLRVSAAELRRNFGVWQERAFAEPVLVVRHGKPRLVLSSAEHFFERAAAAPAAPADAAIQSALAAAPEHSAEGFLVLDPDLRVLAANRAFEQMAGRHAGRMAGRPLAEVLSETAAPAVLEHLRHALAARAAVQFEAPGLTAPGRRFRLSVFPHAGGVAALIAERTLEQDVREDLDAHHSLAAALAAAPGAGHVRVDLQARISEASPQFRRLTGLDAGAPLAEAVAPDRRTDLLQALGTVLEGGEPATLRTALRGPTGDSTAVEMTLAAVRRGVAPQGATGVFTLR